MNPVRTVFWFIVAALMFAATSPMASACTACFGQSDSNMAKGMNMGIAVLLLVITCVLCGVAGFFVYLAKRSAQLEDGQFEHTLSQNRTNA
jgi:hypothetical protein